MNTTPLLRGTVVMVELPRSAGKTGHEQHGARPAVIVQANINQNDSTVVLVPLTSQPGALRFPGSFEVEANSENGLSMKSIVLVHQIRAIDKSRIFALKGTLSNIDLLQLDSSLVSLLGLTR